jgi:hypothetical protein
MAWEGRGPFLAKRAMGTTRTRKNSRHDSRKMPSEAAVLITHLQEELNGLYFTI